MGRKGQGIAAGVLALVLSSAAVAAQATADDIHQYRLDNGMHILVRVDQRAPAVVSQLWYRVGSVDEYRGVTGISHVLEHMMFQGTKKHGPGELSAIVSRHGGDENAFTSHDYTAYYERVAAKNLGLMLRLEADRMTNLTLDPKQFKRELGVIREERRRRLEDQPQALTWERLSATAFPAGGRHAPVLGWKADLTALTDHKVRQWYQRWYGPNNAALVVVGDVDPDHVHALAQKYFGDKKPIKLPARTPASRFEQMGEQRIKVHAPARLGYLAMGWRVPTLGSTDKPRDVYALDVLAGVLDGGRSARIERDIIRDRGLASSASAGYSAIARTQTLFSVSGTPAPGHSVDELETALREEVEGLKHGRIDADELQRVKTNVRAQEVFQRDSMFYQALRIGLFQTVGVGQKAYDRFQKGIQQVTAADVQRVARKYLTDRRLTVAHLIPTELSGQTPNAGSRRAPGGNGGPNAIAH